MLFKGGAILDEKSMRIQGAGSGENIACFDGAEQDDQANDRIIQQYDLIGGIKFDTPLGTPLRTLTENEDGWVVADWVANFYDNLIEVGDKTTVIACIDMDMPDIPGSISPILFDNDDNVIGAGTRESFLSSASYRRGTEWNFPTALIQWPTFGAHYVGFNVLIIGTWTLAKIYAYVV